MTHSTVPVSCDVLVIGAGPAGSACAQTLAARGLRVVVVDQYAFPRDKVCGDGLAPDAHAALRALGLYDAVMTQAHRVPYLRAVGPRAGAVDVPGELAVLPRRILDDILCRSAQSAGAQLLAPARFDAPLLDGDRCVGARLRFDGVAHELRSPWVVLATGAVPQALIAADMCLRRGPSGIAMRGYVKNDAMADRITALEIIWHRRIRGGYGWIFPCGNGVFNIGVGMPHSRRSVAPGTRAPTDINLRTMFDALCAVHPAATELMATGVLQGAMKGAPLRCSLDGARYSKPGLLVTGEAAGATYSFTGEGIGKALETGILAARAILDGAAQNLSDTAVRSNYETALLALKPRFAMYERANAVNSHPWLIDLIIWRARQSARILRGMASVLNETGDPSKLVSARGLMRLFVPGR